MATELKLRDTQTHGIGRFGEFIFDMVTAFGASARTAVVDTVTSGTDIQWTWEITRDWEISWVSGRVPAGGFTLTSLTVIDMWASESMSTANCGGRIRLYKFSPTGVETELAGGPFNDGVEFGTALAQMSWTANPTDTAFAENDRLMLKVFITNIGIMAGALTCSLSFNAATGTTGDSLITLNETVTFKPENNFTGHTLIAHLDGVDASTTITDSSNRGHAFTVSGNAQLDTAESKFGTASLLLDGTGDFIKLGIHSQDFAFLRNNFTIDFWIKRARASTGENLFDTRPLGEVGGDAGPFGGRAFPVIHIDASDKLNFFADAVNRITGTTSITNDGSFHHVALTRSGNDHRLFLDGVQEGSTFTSDLDYYCGMGGPWFGSDTGAAGSFSGWMDEIHVERGVAEWTANFTPPTVPWAETVPSSLVWYPTYFNPLIVR